MRPKSTLFSAARDTGCSGVFDVPRPPAARVRPSNRSITRRYAIRELEQSDLPEAARILAEGFPTHSVDRWRRRLQILAQREHIPGTPRFGFGLDADGLQGVGLTISSLHGPLEARQTIVNLSSWTVRPAYRGPAAIELYRHSMRCAGQGTTFSNLSPAMKTLEIIKMCGFTEHTAGAVIGVGAARARGPKRRIVRLSDVERFGLTSEQEEAMRYHEAHGCLTFFVEDKERPVPFIFTARSIFPGLRLAQLIYCEKIEDLVENSRAITVEVLKFGCTALLIDASGPIKGLKGRYFHGLKPRYYKGSPPLYAIDHSYSELVYFCL